MIIFYFLHRVVRYPKNRGLGYVENHFNSNFIYKSVHSINNNRKIELAIMTKIRTQIVDFMSSSGKILTFASECTTNERRLIHK